MAVSTGPIIAAGGITWVNNALLGSNPGDSQDSFRILFGTAVAAGFMYGVEMISADLARALSYAALVTVLFVRVGNTPTPAERILSLV